MANKGNRSGPAVLFSCIKASQGSMHVGSGSIGACQALAFPAAPTSLFGDGSFGRHMQVGVLRNNSEGNPAQPSLQLDVPGMWRFRWSVQAGSRYIQVNCKQVNNGLPRPTMVVKAASGILASDQTGTAGSSTGWVTITVSFTALTAGALWVELHNNDYALVPAAGATAAHNPCYFDHLVAT